VHTVAVVGGGLLGCVSALLAARDGHRVQLLEREDQLFTGASANNEGKIHLGPTFALADPATHEVMLGSALVFAEIVEDALEAPVDWEDLAGDTFDYLVMPDSLLSPHGLAQVYRSINGNLPTSARYLGRPITRVVDPTARRDIDTGLTAFRTEERSIDVRRLGELLSRAVAAHPRIEITTGTPVVRLHPVGSAVDVVLPDRVERVDAAINCAWDQQSVLVPDERRMLNFRVKAALRLTPWPGSRTVTLVQGPYGDVVTHQDHVYASWYPVGRLSNEMAVTPSTAAMESVVSARQIPELGDAQVRALQDIGLVPEAVHIEEILAGFILGHGDLDIDSPESLLHTRGVFGVDRLGMIFTPRNFKLSSAPRAAQRAVAAVGAAL
jgi:glycine/D-amino acid oxidase-like deaminating enzyme